MPYVPPGPSGMPQGWGEQDDPMYVEPGAWIQLQEEELILEEHIADEQAEIQRLQIKLGQETNEIERDKLREQIRANKADLQIRREELAEKRRVTELGLANSPIDFVAYEMYKRYLQGQADAGKPAVSPSAAASVFEDFLENINIEDIPPGLLPPGMGPPTPPPSTGHEGGPPPGLGQPVSPWHLPPGAGEPSPHIVQPTLPEFGGPVTEPEPPFAGPFSAPRTDEEIQAMIAAMVGEGGGSLGVGAFGVDVPMTQAISRQEGRGYSQEEMAILSSFLRAGFDVNGQEVSYDPADYWREVQEGWVPTIRTPESTQYAY